MASATAPASVISAAPLPDAEPVPVPAPVKSPFIVPVTFQLPAKEYPAAMTNQVNPTSFFNTASGKSIKAPKPTTYVPGTEYSRA